ncbi:MAG: hypothetical protein ABII74_10135 [Elusimicrobiota bacterium]
MKKVNLIKATIYICHFGLQAELFLPSDFNLSRSNFFIFIARLPVIEVVCLYPVYYSISANTCLFFS